MTGERESCTMNERKEKEKQSFFILLHHYEKEVRHYLGIFILTDVIDIYIMINYNISCIHILDIY